MDFKTLVISKYPDLPNHQKRVGDFFLEHPHDFAMLSILDLASKIGVSEATIFRFAQSLGFRSFTHFKNSVMEETQKIVKPAQPFKLLKEEELPDNTLTGVARMDIENINMTMHKISPERFNSAVNLIDKADHVYTCGLGVSAISCRVLAYLLNQMAIPAKVFLHDSATFIEQVTFLKPSDLLITFSFPPYSRESVEKSTARWSGWFHRFCAALPARRYRTPVAAQPLVPLRNSGGEPARLFPDWSAGGVER